MYDFIGFNIVFIIWYKIAIFDIFTQMLHLIEWRYGQKVVFICTNRKKTLTKIYQNEFALQNIILEIFASYTPEQNSHAKHQKCMLASKACIICIAVNLLQNL